jgi:hypothetical protein
MQSRKSAASHLLYPDRLFSYEMFETLRQILNSVITSPKQSFFKKFLFYSC